MKLLTKALEKRFAEVGPQDVEDPLVITKFFHPFSPWYHYIVAYHPEDRMFFGWTDGPHPELGYYSLDELQGLKVRGLPMERDRYFNECRLSKFKPIEAKPNQEGKNDGNAIN